MSKKDEVQAGADLSKEPEPMVLELQGVTYQLAKLNLNTMSALEERLGCSVTDLQAQFDKRMATTTRAILWVLIKASAEPLGMTEEMVGELVTADNMEYVSRQLEQVLKQAT